TVIESDIFYGYKEGFSALHIAHLLEGKILLLIEKKDGWEDEAGFFSERLNNTLLGIVLNKGEESDLKKEGLLGVIPYEGNLSTISANQIAEELYATILAGDDGLEKVIENILVGAMTVEHATKYFLQEKNKCIITGGDREDIIMSALSTSTSCVVITGDIVPSISVIEKAERKRIPLLSVSWDTFTTAEKIEAIVPRIRPENKEMLARIKEMTKPTADKIASLLSL
ncbi:MAG: DRTGG domain-containing protein, partial [Candidatus Desantisbacteria bacterium]